MIPRVPKDRKTVIDFDKLDTDQLRRLCRHFNERTEALLAVNVSLIERLGSGENASPDDHIRILNEWTAVQEDLIQGSDQEIMNIVAVRNSTMN